MKTFSPHNLSFLFALSILTAPIILATQSFASDEKEAAAIEKVLVDPQAIKNGETRFAQTCAYCHGNKGSGGKAKTLQCRKRLTSDYVFEVITNGKKRGSMIMPPWKDTFNDHERWELTAYIMTFQKLPECSE